MPLQLPLCFFNRHTPVRNRTKWDGLHFISTCQFCGKPIRRRDKKRWEQEWLDEDGRNLSASDGAAPRQQPEAGPGGEAPPAEE